MQYSAWSGGSSLRSSSGKMYGCTNTIIRIEWFFFLQKLNNVKVYVNNVHCKNFENLKKEELVEDSLANRIQYVQCKGVKIHNKKLSRWLFHKDQY